MAPKFRTYQPDQLLLLPPDLRSWLPQGHLCYFISDTVDALELGSLLDGFNEEGRGEQPYHPKMMLKLLLYGYCTGVFSSRGIARKIEEDIAFRVLASGNEPNHRTICRFRERHLEVFSDLFKQVVEIGKEAKLVKLGIVAIDGTKVKANASKHKAMSYGRMRESEARLDKEIKELIRQARETDEAEDKRYGDLRGDELPKEIERREDRLRVIREAKTRIEERQRKKDSERGRSDDDDRNASGARPQRGRSKFRRAFGVPDDKAQDNFTDPESRIMKTSWGGFEQCYNAQAAVDAEQQIIVAVHVTDNASDSEQLVQSIEQIQSVCEELPKIVLADAGYRSEENFKALEQRGIQGVVALGREGKPSPVTVKARPATVRMAKRVQSKRGDRLYRKRKAIVEPVFGLIKRVLGFRAFSLRSLTKVSGEWSLVCTALNLRRMSNKVVWKLA